MRCRLTLAVLLVTAATAAGAGPNDSLLKVVPATANTLVLINSEAIFKSQLAQSLKWAETFAQRFRAGATSIPPESKRIVIACNTNTRTFAREWQVALAHMHQVPNPRSVAAREGGTVDEVAGRPAALSPRHVYFTTMSEEETATWYPANRQLLAHWVRTLKAAQGRKESALSPYFQDVVKAHGEAAHMVIALDVSDAYSLANVQGWLDDSRTLVTHGDVDKVGLAKMISQMHGITLAINVTDKLEATVRADFAVDAIIHRTVLKQLLLEAFEDEGLSMGDLAAWEPAFVGKSMILKGTLEPGMMGRLLSLFEFPQEEEGSEAPKPGAKPSGDATKRYFKAVLACVEEVKALKEQKDYEKTATWHETYARKVNQISTRGVDPEAVQFANGTAERLRAIAGSLRGVPIDVKAAASGGYAIVSSSVYGGGRGWGWRGRGASYDLNTNLPQTNAAIQKVIAEDAKKRTEIWSQIDSATVEYRQKLTATYGSGF